MDEQLTDAPQPAPIPPPSEVKTLCLYTNAYGEQFQCVLTHNEGIDVSAEDLTSVLPGFCKEKSLYLISLYDEDRPEITDGYGQEIPCVFATLE